MVLCSQWDFVLLARNASIGANMPTLTVLGARLVHMATLRFAALRSSKGYMLANTIVELGFPPFEARLGLLSPHAGVPLPGAAAVATWSGIAANAKHNPPVEM